MIMYPHVFGNDYIFLQIHPLNLENEPVFLGDGILDIGGTSIVLSNMISVIKLIFN